MTGKGFWIAIGFNTACMVLNIAIAFFFQAWWNITMAVISFGVIVFLFLSRERKERRDNAPIDMRKRNDRI